ncbi:hypothetical protein PAXINDRAFT_95583 [Paxillus involutus ATCC 200175]|nr:hypothetical protein PAXINDRAFT_95583 [Paxillus involutus ATCC 200175]
MKFTRLYHASSIARRPVSVCLFHQCTPAAFSSSAIYSALRPPKRFVRDNGGDEFAALGLSREQLESEGVDFDIDEEDGFSEAEQSNELPDRNVQLDYKSWVETVAPAFREPSRNWLGGDVPFPLNPSFKPPTPLSDAFRSQLYRAYMANPEVNSGRTLATRHNISMKRVDAILRLKGMEEAWKKNKPVQTGFTKGMEELLGVTDATRRMQEEPDGDTPIQYHHTVRSAQEDPHNRYDVDEADRQDEVAGNDMARRRYQRMFWESVAEGEEPVMPTVLETVRSSALVRAKLKGKTTLVERGPGRPAVKFIDVGNAFIDEKEKERREREGARRSVLKTRKRERERTLYA